MSEAVDIHIKEVNDLGAALAGVVVKILSVDGLQTYGQATTNAQGVASFLLPVGTYQVRFFKFAVNFANPVLLAVVPGLNVFDVYGTPHVPPVSTDPRLCMASGFFRTISGAPHKHLDIHFIAKFDPILLEGAGVLSERVAVRTDERGFAAVPLIRYAQYDVTLEGMENVYRSVNVPDAASTSLPDLLFPVIKGVTFDAVTPPIAMTVGEVLELQGHVLTTDLRELTDLGSDIMWSLSDPTVLNFELLSGGILRLRALNAGTCNVQGERRDKTIIRIPDVAIEGLPLQVTVS